MNSIKDDETLSVLLKKSFTEWLETSSSHGLPNMVRSKNIIIRIMWGFIFLGGLAASIYFLVTSLLKYFEYPVNVQISLIQQSSVDFPAVTICNLNRLNYARPSVAHYLNRFLSANNYSFIENLNDTSEMLDYAGEDNVGDLLTDMAENLKLEITAKQSLSFLEKLKLGFDLENDMLLRCSYNQHTCDTTLDFTVFINHNYGNCYTFNSGFNDEGEQIAIKQQTESGSQAGLHLELVVGDSTKVEYASNFGIYLVIHNQTKRPSMIKDGDGIFLSDGFDTLVSVKREVRSKLEKPFSDCVKDLNSAQDSDDTYKKTLFAYMKGFNMSYYDRDFCKRLCYQDKLIDNCTCADPNQPYIRNAKYCTSNVLESCRVEFYLNFTSLKMNKFCESFCDIQCDSTIYQLTSSSARYPTAYYMQMLSTDSNAERLINFTRVNDFKLLRVRINYEDLSYTLIQDVQAITPDSLVGNVGGQFGLFIGISLMSVLEIFEILLEFARIIYTYRKRRMTINAIMVKTA